MGHLIDTLRHALGFFVAKTFLWGAVVAHCQKFGVGVGLGLENRSRETGIGTRA